MPDGAGTELMTRRRQRASRALGGACLRPQCGLTSLQAPGNPGALFPRVIPHRSRRDLRPCERFGLLGSHPLRVLTPFPSFCDAEILSKTLK